MLWRPGGRHRGSRCRPPPPAPPPPLSPPVRARTQPSTPEEIGRAGVGALGLRALSTVVSVYKSPCNPEAEFQIEMQAWFLGIDASVIFLAFGCTALLVKRLEVGAASRSARASACAASSSCTRSASRRSTRLASSTCCARSPRHPPHPLVPRRRRRPRRPLRAGLALRRGAANSKRSPAPPTSRRRRRRRPMRRRPRSSTSPKSCATSSCCSRRTASASARAMRGRTRARPASGVMLDVLRSPRSAASNIVPASPDAALSAGAEATTRERRRWRALGHRRRRAPAGSTQRSRSPGSRATKSTSTTTAPRTSRRCALWSRRRDRRLTPPSRRSISSCPSSRAGAGSSRPARAARARFIVRVLLRWALPRALRTRSYWAAEGDYFVACATCSRPARRLRARRFEEFRRCRRSSASTLARAEGEDVVAVLVAKVSRHSPTRHHVSQFTYACPRVRVDSRPTTTPRARSLHSRRARAGRGPVS